MCFPHPEFTKKIVFRTKVNRGDGITVWNVEAFIPHRCPQGEFPVRMPFPAFLLGPPSGLLLLFIQQAQLSFFRKMGFGGVLFSTDLPAMISCVTLLITSSTPSPVFTDLEKHRNPITFSLIFCS
jgi:hypothetical protein